MDRERHSAGVAHNEVRIKQKQTRASVSAPEDAEKEGIYGVRRKDGHGGRQEESEHFFNDERRKGQGRSVC